MKNILAIWALALIGPACAATAEQPASGPRAGRECFNIRTVDDFSPVDRDTVRLGAGPSRVYEVDISGGLCDQLDWAQRIVLESRPSAWICTGDGPGLGNIYFRDLGSQQRVSCYIEAVRRMETKR